MRTLESSSVGSPGGTAVAAAHDRATHVSVDALRWTREEFDEVFEMCRRVTAKIADGVMACEKPDVLASAICKLLEHVNDPPFEG